LIAYYASVHAGTHIYFVGRWFNFCLASLWKEPRGECSPINYTRSNRQGRSLGK